MKIKSTSKRSFKKILTAMMKQSAFKINNKEFGFYAASNFDCGIKTYKGYQIDFIPVGYLGLKSGYIYLTLKVNVQTDYFNK
jgi:hypothetical protein